MENHYFLEYDEAEDEFIVYFGTNSDDFNASWIAAFIKEEDADEYVTWKNNCLEEQEPNTLDNDVIDPEWDEPLEEDLVARFSKDREYD